MLFPKPSKKKKSKGKVAKFSQETKEAIYNRDGGRCIFCGGVTGLQAHHAYFSNENNRGDNRNDVDQGVTACQVDHSDGRQKVIYTLY